MANTVTSFYQTLVQAASESSQVLSYNLKAVDAVRLDTGEGVADIGQTINVPIPASQSGNIYDAAASDITLYDVSAATKPIVFNKHPMASFVIRDFEQFNTPERLRTIFLDGAMKGIKENINAAITALFTTTKFNVNAAVACTGGIVTVTQFGTGRTNLSDQKVPITDTANMSFLLGSKPYVSMQDSSTTAGGAWVQAQIAGERQASMVRDSGETPVQFGCTLKLDQQMPVTGSAPNRTFTGILLHKWAACVATRRLPEPDGRVVDYTYVDFGGIPVRVQLGYNQLKNGYVVTVDAGYGLDVIRPEMGQIFTIAE